MNTKEESSRLESLVAVVAVFGIMALICSLIGIGIAAQAASKKSSASAPESASATTSITSSISLMEYMIMPQDINVNAGASLKVNNLGTMVHNFTIVDHSVTTGDIQPGSSANIDLSSLAPGTYKAICDVPGHSSLGMTSTVHVTAAGGATASDATSAQNAASTPTTMSSDQMDAVMKKSTDEFVAAVTSGKAPPLAPPLLAPKVLADGTKEFDLTASVIDWAVSPGKTVKAWAYNNTVPGPTIKTNVGDHVKIVLTNHLPESTVIHWHGVQDLPNSVDGVPFITQPQIKPNTSYTYEFDTPTQSVGMYHSHFDAQTQVPNGLLGAFIVGAVPLPNNVTPSQEIPIVLNDAGTIGLTINGHSFPGTGAIMAKQGDWIEIHYMNEGLMAHPMHTHGFEGLVVAKDGVKLASPYYADTINVAPGERYSVLIHTDKKGVWAFHCHILTHAEGPNGMFGMVTAIIVT